MTHANLFLGGMVLFVVVVGVVSRFRKASLIFYGVVLVLLAVGAAFLIPKMWRDDHDWAGIIKFIALLIAPAAGIFKLNQMRKDEDERRKAVQQAATESWSESSTSDKAE